MAPAIPSAPVPRSASVEGSGIGALLFNINERVAFRPAAPLGEADLRVEGDGVAEIAGEGRIEGTDRGRIEYKEIVA